MIVRHAHLGGVGAPLSNDPAFCSFPHFVALLRTRGVLCTGKRRSAAATGDSKAMGVHEIIIPWPPFTSPVKYCYSTIFAPPPSDDALLNFFSFLRDMALIITFIYSFASLLLADGAPGRSSFCLLFLNL